jgi:type III pantothenate kinase
MPIIAADIGNSRIKLGLFSALSGAAANATAKLPQPEREISIPALQWDNAVLEAWLSDVPKATPWWIASVNRPAAARLNDRIGKHWHVRNLQDTDLPITAAVERPDHVGIDRLAGAVAANRLREPSRPAIIVHVGSAITVNLVTADGVFRGGAILPGLGTSARALHDFTDMLPHVSLEDLSQQPAPVGTSTLDAIHSGLHWGAVGAIRELVSRIRDSIGAAGKNAELFLTVGAAPAVAEQLEPSTRYVEHLVLSGIALAKP